MSLRVLEPGPLTTVQDAGRTGFAARGFRCCGAADAYARRLANLLAGNDDEGVAVLEMTLRGVKVRFEQDTLFALAGAAMPAALDQAPVPAFAPLFAPAGSVLTVGAAQTGLRGYLAVFGGIDTPPVLGSRSTDLKCRLGGLEGRALRAGDLLPVGADGSAARQRWQSLPDRAPLREKEICQAARPWRFWGARACPLFRAVPGPQADAFTQAGKTALVHSVYTLTADCDRMACKLHGTPLEAVNGVDIVSDGIVAGSVQVSANGQPIVML
ncbi:MAG: biotin-dependent carboxyltransferase family protein, partial [Gemmiger sp.]